MGKDLGERELCLAFEAFTREQVAVAPGLEAPHAALTPSSCQRKARLTTLQAQRQPGHDAHQALVSVRADEADGVLVCWAGSGEMRATHVLSNGVFAAG